MFYSSKSITKRKKKEPQRSPKILGLGLIKLDFYLNLTDEQIHKHNIDFNKIHSPKDLAFLADDPTLLDLIQISSSDTLSNILLFINKASFQKSFVELITLSAIKTHPEEEHMKKIFNHITEHNYLFSNEMSVTNVPNKISFAFKNGKKLLKYFDIETNYDPNDNEIFNEDDIDQHNEKLNNLYNRIKASIDKNENEFKNFENMKDTINDEKNKTGDLDDNKDIDSLAKNEIYNNLSKKIKAAELNDDGINLDGINNKINEVNEDEANSNPNHSVRKTTSRKTNTKGDEHSEKSNLKSINMEDAISHKEDIKEIDQSNMSQNKSRITNKSNSKRENLHEEKRIENESSKNINNLNNDENNLEENSENASVNERFKILKANSEDRNFDSSNNKQNELNDFEMEDLNDIRDENSHYSNSKTESNKKENYVPNQGNNIQAGEIKSDTLIKNLKSSSVHSKEQNISQKEELSIKIREESNKDIRPIHDGSDFSRHDNSIKSEAKLINIPSACQIEEYDFLFIDLEEFINFHVNGFHLNELAEFMKKISTNDKKPRIVINYPNILINLNVVNLELLETILAIMSYTDIFLFEKKECLAFFNMLNQMNYEKDLNDKQLMDFFFKEVLHKKTSVSKLGLFLDELQKFYIGEQKKDKILNNISYEINLHPKINHFNQKIVEEYKKIMTINNSYFKSIFFGGYFSSYIFNEDQYTSFYTGAESTKRILEIFRNKIDFPINPEFYVIKLQKNRIVKNLEQEKLKKKEERFVLDCVNKTNSTIKSYNPLLDDNLNAFFASAVIRKQLKDKGFINTNGFVLYDSSYKSVLGGPPKPKKRLDTSEREKHLLLAIKQNRGLLSTDLESFSKSLKGQSPTNRKLPLPSFDLNSSNLYISAKINNLKATKKKLKPIFSTRKSSSRIKERSQEEKNTYSDKSKKGQKENSMSKKKINSNISKSNHKNNNSINKSKERFSYNNDSIEALSNNLLKNENDNINNFNYDFIDKSKVNSQKESIKDANSENEFSKSQAKSKTHTVSMGHNQRYSEQSKNENIESKPNNEENNSKLISDKKEIDESKHITTNNMEDINKMENINKDNLDASFHSKIKKEEKIDGNEGEHIDLKVEENKDSVEELNKNENDVDHNNLANNENVINAEAEMNENNLDEEEKKDKNTDENKEIINVEKQEENEENEENNIEINQEEMPKDEDKVEAEN